MKPDATGQARHVLTAAVRAGSLAASLLAAWSFFHLLPSAMRAVSGEMRDSARWLQSGLSVDDE